MTVFRCDNEEFGCEVVVKLDILAMHLKVLFTIKRVLCTAFMKVVCNSFDLFCSFKSQCREVARLKTGMPV